MAKKRERKIKAVFTVFVYEDGSPMEAMLPDGRMALVIDRGDWMACTGVHQAQGIIRKHRGGKIEIIDDEHGDLEKCRQKLISYGAYQSEAKKMALESRPMVSFW
jgi:hypothetical protein